MGLGSDLKRFVGAETPAPVPADEKYYGDPRGLVIGGRYEVLERLGQGSMAVVYRVRDQRKETEYALKLLHPHLSRDELIKRSFMRAVVKAQGLEHPGVVRIFHDDEHAGIPFFTMELLPQPTLRALMGQEGRMAWRPALDLTRALLEAVAQAHGLREPVWHLYLRPENVKVLEGQPPRVKVLDFGLAKVGGQNLTLAGPGSPGYMSPEQEAGQAVGAYSDVYALGCLLYEMVTGRAAKGRFKLPGELPGLRGKIPRELDVLLDKALQPEPEDRFSDAGAMLGAVKAILSKGKTQSLPTRPVRKTAQAQAPEPARRAEQPLPPRITNSLGMELVLIPAGQFLMGGEEFSNELPLHTVEITRPFYLGVTTVTQGEWRAVMGSKLSFFHGDDRLPVTDVSYYDTQWFMKNLIALEKSNKYRLPSEAEWEYACRAGSKGKYCFGDSERELKDYAWFDGNSGGEKHLVKTKLPNAWGLYDMHGNVTEWCADYYSESYYKVSPSNDPPGPQSGSSFTVRGGNYISFPKWVRSATRGFFGATIRDIFKGFRVAMTP